MMESFLPSKQIGKQNSYLSYKWHCSCDNCYAVMLGLFQVWCLPPFLRTWKENEEHSWLEPTYKQVEPVSHVDINEELAEKAWW